MEEKFGEGTVCKPNNGSALFNITYDIGDGSKYVVHCVINNENIGSLCKSLFVNCDDESLKMLQEGYSNYLISQQPSPNENSSKFIAELLCALRNIEINSIAKINVCKTRVTRNLAIQIDKYEVVVADFDFFVVPNTPHCILTNEERNFILFEYNYNDVNLILCDNNMYKVNVQDGVQFETKEEQLCFLSKIHSAYNDYYKEKYGYQVTGSVPKTPLISAVMSKQNFNNHCKVIPTAIKDKFSKQTVNNMITTNGLSLIPIGAKRHATLLIVEKINGNASYLYSLIDTSLQHVMLDKKQVITDIFDGFNDNEINVLLTSPLQINGCCSYWVDSFMEAIVMNPEKYTSMESIKNAINDGSLICEACCIMSQIFDERGRETVKKISENEINNDEYIVFNIGSEKYGINKNCYNNRFVTIRNLINCLSTEEQKTTKEELMKELEVQSKKQEKLRPLVLFVNKTEKLMKQKEEILKFYDELVSMNENERDKIIENINGKEKEKIRTQLDECLKQGIDKESLRKKQIEHLGLVKNTICELLNHDNEMFVENFEQECDECTKVEGFITLFNLNIIKESYSKQQTIDTQKPSSCELEVDETVLMYDNIAESKNEVVLTLPTIILQPSPSPEIKEKASEIKQQLDGKNKQQDLHNEIAGVLFKLW